MDLFALTEPLRRRRLIGYLLALLLSLLALEVRFWAGSSLVGYPYVTFFPAILFSTYLAGRGPGALCGLLSGVFAWYFYIEPINSFAFNWPTTAIALSFYTFVAGSIVLTVSTMNRAYGRLRLSERALAQLNEQLESRVEERTRALTTANEGMRGAVEAREAAEERVAQLQRLEAIGQLTGGIAHDFNNLLGIIIGNLDLAERKINRGSADVMRHLHSALEGAKRGASLTQRLLAFARRQPLNPAVSDLNGLVSVTSELLRRTLGEHIEVECVLAAGLWRTFIDPGQLESALVNLAVNARDAMPQGGKLTVETGNTALDAHYATGNPDVIPGDYVVVAVSDTGSGMTTDVVAHAFEPFFTTKEVGRGTGLGLSQIYGFMRQSDGHSKIYSEPGIGTTIKLYFPRYMGEDAPLAPDERTLISSRPEGRSGEIILVVEDEPGVRATTTETLRELGYDVRYAPDGATALSILAKIEATLLLTDVVMPGMTGRELAEEAARRQPGIKVLYTTGYTRNAIVHGGKLEPGVELLPKPFTTDQLAQKVRMVIDAPPRSGR